MAAAHSVSRWINQSEFQLSPSISGNNLGDIIKVPVCRSRGQRVLLSFSDSPSLPLLSRQQQWIKRNEHGCVVRGNTTKHLLVFCFFFFSYGFVTTTAAWIFFFFFELLWLKAKQEFFQLHRHLVSLLPSWNWTKSADLDSKRIITHHLPYITHLASRDDGVF